MSKISNVFMMLELLAGGRKYSISELAEKLEVSPRMVRVYKEELAKAGIYLHTIKGPYGGYVLNQAINIPMRFVPVNDINIKDKKIYNTINLAIKTKKKCLIEYYSNVDDLLFRTIHPYEVLLFGNEFVVVAHCEMRNEARNFYINRIKSIKILEEFYK